MYILGISAYYHDSAACILNDFIEVMTRKTITDIKEKSWDEY